MALVVSVPEWKHSEGMRVRGCLPVPTQATGAQCVPALPLFSHLAMLVRETKRELPQPSQIRQRSLRRKHYSQAQLGVKQMGPGSPGRGAV